VRRAEPADDRRIVEALVDAYEDDPVMNYAFRAGSGRRRAFALYYATMLERFHDTGHVLVAGDCDAAALWAPPHRWRVSMRDQIALAPRIAGMLGLRLARGLRVISAIQSAHPLAPHWYLCIVGVRRSKQGRGLGGRLVRAGLDLADRDGLPAYLESSNERNLPLYRRHGFEVTRVLEIGGGVRMWLMWREGRP
jgi:ribosomal protein S18 acetylase RimI-like enzyme